MIWECDLCGACCETFAPIVFGKECESYNKVTKQCNDYENRPQVCRIDLVKLLSKNDVNLKGVNIEEYLIARCQLLKHLKKWKKETQHVPQGQQILLQAICKAKLM